MKKFLQLLVINLMIISFVNAGYTLSNGQLVDADAMATRSPEEHFHIGMSALQHSDWREASRQFYIVTSNFPKTTLGQDAYFYLGVSYFNLAEYDFANEAFSQYIKCNANPQHFEEAVTYKFAIANEFRQGALKHIFGWKHMPKWSGGSSLALAIYDEVIAAMPSHEIAAQALYAKAETLWQQKLYQQSVDVYQQIIRRFPKNELTPQSYLAISKIYVDQSKNEIQNPDALALAIINCRKFRHDFPREELVAEVEQDVMNIKESYAKGIYDTGLYYERKDHPEASLIYYRKAIDQFPETVTAQKCLMRLTWLTNCLKTDPTFQANLPGGH